MVDGLEMVLMVLIGVLRIFTIWLLIIIAIISILCGSVYIIENIRNMIRSFKK